ncbi:MAG: hypothetical protein SFU86_10720 [Pirellulaceae bacterium]|nr:hypothetical protein [Pirellulaceae bacterium]
MWDYDSVWKKACVFMQRALGEEDRDGEVFPLWASFALEMLCRASLAKVHPTLLADAKEGTDNILHACGFPTKQPKSIQMKLVVERCQKVCPGFTDRESKLCSSMAERRNEDLHSGATPFASIKHTDWLGDFYRVCSILIEHQNQPLEQFLGKDEAEAAKEMMVAIAADRRAEAHRLVEEARTAFQEMSIELRLEAIRTGESLRKNDWKSWGKHQDIACPACEGPARLHGKLVWKSKPKDDDGSLAQDEIYLPTELKCYSCPLSITGHEFLHGIGLGAQFKRTAYLDPVEHFSIDPGEYGWLDEDALEEKKRDWEHEQRHRYDEPD